MSHLLEIAPTTRRLLNSAARVTGALELSPASAFVIRREESFAAVGVPPHAAAWPGLAEWSGLAALVGARRLYPRGAGVCRRLARRQHHRRSPAGRPAGVLVSLRHPLRGVACGLRPRS